MSHQQTGEIFAGTWGDDDTDDREEASQDADRDHKTLQAAI